MQQPFDESAPGHDDPGDPRALQGQPLQPDWLAQTSQQGQCRAGGHSWAGAPDPFWDQLNDDARAFALIARSDSAEVEFLGCDTADLVDVASTADIPLPDPVSGAAGPRMLALVPFAQVRELGYAAHADSTPLRCLPVRRSTRYSRSWVLDRLREPELQVREGGFTTGDEEYADVVKRIVVDEIGRGEGANFVIRRDYTAMVDRPARATALALFRRLLRQETGAYWTFVICAGDQILVGATPERHVAVANGAVRMNPISGTYRYPAEGPSVDGLLDFLADPKETDELVMVVDEELKQLSAVCEAGGQVAGPYLQPMRHLAHTAYHLIGESHRDVREVLRGTMFAATVTGSPVENACRVIADYEAGGRGYYGAVAALFGEDEQGRQTLDAPILIRAAYLTDPATVAAATPRAQVRVPVGTTVVRHSTPEGEVAETHAKIAALLQALTGAHAGVPSAGSAASAVTFTAGATAAGATAAGATAAGATAPHDTGARTAGTIETIATTDWADNAADVAAGSNAALFDAPAVRAALARRNDHLAPFWLHHQSNRTSALSGAWVELVDAEDAWTQMLAHLFRRLGAQVGVRRWDALTPEATLRPSRASAARAHSAAGAHRGEGIDGSTGASSPVEAADLLVAGPGPGDPKDTDAPRIATLQKLLQQRLTTGRPLLAVCLSHQVLASCLGYRIEQLTTPYQGAQRQVNVFGRDERAGFYNTFVVRPRPQPTGLVDPAAVQEGVHRDEVITLRGPAFASVQFHLESILTTHGIDLMAALATDLMV